MNLLTYILISLCVCTNATALERILLVGDSITHGQFSGPAGKSWANRVRDHFADRYKVINVGLPGSTTHDWSTIREAKWSVPPYQEKGAIFNLRAKPQLPAKLVTLMLGTNDSVGFMMASPITPEEYKVNLYNIVNNLLSAGAEKVLIMIPPKRLIDSDEVNNRILDYAKIIFELVATNDFVYLGPVFYTELKTRHFDRVKYGNGMLLDIHPNQQGYAAMAELMIPKMEALLL